MHHVYGETEAGGTNWLYITDVPFETLGFRTDLGPTSPPELTRTALAAVPFVLTLWPPLLMGLYTFSKRRDAGRQRVADRRRRRTMTDMTFDRGFDARSFITEKFFMGMSIREYLKSLLTPGNAIFALILIVGVPIVIYRFAFGIGAVEQPHPGQPVGHLDRLRRPERRRAGGRRASRWPRRSTSSASRSTTRSSGPRC